MITNRGLRHLALKVADVARASDFYQRVFGMKLVWQPDADNAYLSSGCDNLALHRGAVGDRGAQALDHLGFIAASIAEVERGYAWAQANDLTIVNPLKHHRDGSVSFYLSDPDGNVIQLLFEPSISPLNLVRERG
ncbi:MAG TPA: VOC family protein [Candidatus Binataceae bacterium]|nr:VOC family protein [Candidatus Binataceae bacterium]